MIECFWIFFFLKSMPYIVYFILLLVLWSQLQYGIWFFNYSCANLQCYVDQPNINIIINNTARIHSPHFQPTLVVHIVCTYKSTTVDKPKDIKEVGRISIVGCQTTWSSQKGNKAFFFIFIIFFITLLLLYGHFGTIPVATTFFFNVYTKKKKF